MQTILDLDLDFFVWPIEHWPEGPGRLSEADCTVSGSDDVREFLETRCSLKSGKKIPGYEMVEHQDAFFTWRRWVQDGVLSVPFNVIHVDAHADLGLGDGGWVYLLSEVLALPVARRSEPQLGPRGLNSGNYLAFSIANRWMNKLTYVFPYRKPEKQERVLLEVSVGQKFSRRVALGGAVSREAPRPTDLLHLLFRGRNARTGLIELGQYSPNVVKKLGDGTLRPPEPIHVEPAVPFNYIPADQFGFDGFTHMTVAQSPQYTPPSADQLLPLLREYFVEA